MYAYVPRTAPASVSARAAVCATPKSSIFTTASGEITMLCGVTSRCTTLSGRPSRSRRSCAWCSATQICVTIPIATASGIGRLSLAAVRHRSVSVTPLTCSIAKYQYPSAWPRS
jgi:hypothetical protein